MRHAEHYARNRNSLAGLEQNLLFLVHPILVTLASYQYGFSLPDLIVIFFPIPSRPQSASSAGTLESGKSSSVGVGHFNKQELLVFVVGALLPVLLSIGHHH